MEARHLKNVIDNLKIKRTFTGCACHSDWDRWCEVNTRMELACCSVFCAWDHDLQGPTQWRGNRKSEERTLPLSVDSSLWDQDPHSVFRNWCLSVDPTGRKVIVRWEYLLIFNWNSSISPAALLTVSHATEWPKSSVSRVASSLAFSIEEPRWWESGLVSPLSTNATTF